MTYHTLSVRRSMWLRAYERKSRWKEEKIIVPSEMECVVRSFETKSARWQELADSNADRPGHQAYALRQVEQWKGMAARAQAEFDWALGEYVP